MSVSGGIEVIPDLGVDFCGDTYKHKPYFTLPAGMSADDLRSRMHRMQIPPETLGASGLTEGEIRDVVMDFSRV